MHVQAFDNIKKTIIVAIGVLSLLLATLFVSQIIAVSNRAAAACTVPAADYGTLTQTIDVKANATYRAWVRIKAPNTVDNSVYLEVNGNCYKVGDKATTAGQWTWIDYQNGDTNNKINVNLQTGQITVKLIGAEPNVRVDKVIFTTYTACVPLNATDECAPPPDTTKPTVSITSPQNNAKVSGSIDITTNVNDNEGIKKVDFLVNGAVVNTDNQAPYTYRLDTTKLPEGNHNIIAKVTDTSDNFNNSSQVTINVANNSPDLKITALTWVPLSPKVNDEVTFKATVKNDSDTPILNVAGVKVEFKVDGTVIAVSESSIDKLSAGQSIIFTANRPVINDKITWSATSGSHTYSATIDTDNVIEEGNETNNTLEVTSEVASLDTEPPTVNITAPAQETVVTGDVTITADAKDTGVSLLSRVEFYIDNKLASTDNNAPFEYTWKTTDYEDKFYEIRARAYDNAGNSANSDTVFVEVLNNPIDVVDEEKEFDNTDDDTESPPPPANEPNVPSTPISVPLEEITRNAVDIDGNEVVDEFDLSNFFSEWGQQSKTTQLTADFNNDGIVNVFDLSILLSNWSF